MTKQKPKKLKRLEPKPNKRTSPRVLYVEDAAVIRDTISRLLELKGYEVAYAKNGKEGVEMAQRWQPDAMLMDLRMPIMDGYAAIKQIKLNPKTNHIPVIVISAWGSKKERTKAKLAGADEFFVKPPDLTQLTQAIDRVIASSKKS